MSIRLGSTVGSKDVIVRLLRSLLAFVVGFGVVGGVIILFAFASGFDNAVKDWFLYRNEPGFVLWLDDDEKGASVILQHDNTVQLMQPRPDSDEELNCSVREGGTLTLLAVDGRRYFAEYDSTNAEKARAFTTYCPDSAVVLIKEYSWENLVDAHNTEIRRVIQLQEDRELTRKTLEENRKDE